MVVTTSAVNRFHPWDKFHQTLSSQLRRSIAAILQNLHLHHYELPDLVDVAAPLVGVCGCLYDLAVSKFSHPHCSITIVTATKQCAISADDERFTFKKCSIFAKDVFWTCSRSNCRCFDRRILCWRSTCHCR